MKHKKRKKDGCALLMFILFFIITFVNINNVKGHNKDSLVDIYKSFSENNIDKVKTGVLLSKAYQGINTDSVIFYAIEANNGARILKDTNEYLLTLKQLASVYNEVGEIDKLIGVYKRMTHIHLNCGNMKRVASLLNTLGSLYYQKSSYDSTLTFLLLGLQLRELCNDQVGAA
jgi:tetratricopeptide (TPR) repeat protein